MSSNVKRKVHQMLNLKCERMSAQMLEHLRDCCEMLHNVGQCWKMLENVGKCSCNVGKMFADI